FVTSYNAGTGLFSGQTTIPYTSISGTPNLNVYALLSGATFTGTVQIPTAIVTTSLSLNGTVSLLDGTGSAGTSGYVLSSTGSATAWVPQSGTVTHTTGSLTLNAIILGNGVADVKTGAVLPGSASVYYDGTGNFSTPSTSGGTVSLFAKTYQTSSTRVLGTTYQN